MPYPNYSKTLFTKETFGRFSNSVSSSMDGDLLNHLPPISYHNHNSTPGSTYNNNNYPSLARIVVRQTTNVKKNNGLTYTTPSHFHIDIKNKTKKFILMAPIWHKCFRVNPNHMQFGCQSILKRRTCVIIMPSLKLQI